MSIENMSPASKVWVYQCNRELTSEEVIQLKAAAESFVTNWTAHNHALKAEAAIYYNRFIVFVVDETQAEASGCSIDKSVKFVKEAETQFGITLLDRMNLAYRQGDKVLSCTKNEFESLIKSGVITADTIVFNNMITDLAGFKTDWEVPVAKSWHKVMI